MLYNLRVGFGKCAPGYEQNFYKEVSMGEKKKARTRRELELIRWQGLCRRARVLAVQIDRVIPPRVRTISFGLADRKARKGDVLWKR